MLINLLSVRQLSDIFRFHGTGGEDVGRYEGKSDRVFGCGNGQSAKLSFDGSNAITGYTASSTNAGFSAVNKPIIIDNIINGIYFIKIKFDNRVESHRIIKSS